MKKYITIENPKQIDSIKVKLQIEKLAKEGVKSTNILLCMSFCVTDILSKKIVDKFKVIKNHIYFNLNNSTNDTDTD